MEGVGVERTDPFSIVSPNAVSAAAEYLRSDFGRDEVRPSQTPTVVPRLSLK